MTRKEKIAKAEMEKRELERMIAELQQAGVVDVTTPSGSVLRLEIEQVDPFVATLLAAKKAVIGAEPSSRES